MTSPETRVVPSRSRLRDLLGDLPASLWFWPGVAVVLAVAAATVLGRLEPRPGGFLSHLAWPGDSDSARQMLALLATASITVTSLTFSLVVIALQVASTQFSPRLLRTFARERTVRVTLAVLVGTFVYAVVALSTVQGSSRHPPAGAMLGALALALAEVGTLVWFLSAIVTLLRVDTMMREAHRDTLATMRRVHPRQEPADLDRTAAGQRMPTPPRGAALLRARDSGLVQTLDLDALTPWVLAHGLVVRLDVAPGDHVVDGVPFGWAWPHRAGPDDPGGCTGVDADDAAREVARAVVVGFERTAEHDVAFGFRQLVDVGVRAMSPAVNDPTTATHAVSHLASLLCALTGRRTGPDLRTDDAGDVRVAAPGRDFAYYTGLSCAQIRRVGVRDVRVAVALVEMLRDVAACTCTDAQRSAVSAEVDRVARAAERETPEQDDLELVRRATRDARRALAGEWVTAEVGRSEAGEDITS